MKHTPAPWIVESDDSGILITAEKGGMCVSVTYTQPNHSDMANARLIASAPELLAALERAVEAADHRGMNGDLEALQMASAALKKAQS